MQLRHLQHFIAIVEEKTFALGARRVCITQPALSRSLRMLEASLQVRLIDRGLRHSMPTAAGEQLPPYAGAILADCDRARSAVDSVDDHWTQPLSVGINAPLSSWLARRLASDIRQELPESQLCLKEGTLEELLRQVRQGRIPFALSVLPRDALDPMVLSEPLTSLHSVVMGPGQPGRHSGRRSPAPVLLRSRWVTLDGLDDHVALHRHFLRHGRASTCVNVTASLGRLRSLVLEEGYLAFAPPDLLRPELCRGALEVFDVDGLRATRKVGFLHPADTPSSAAIERVKAIIRRCAIETDAGTVAELVLGASRRSVAFHS